MTENVPLYDEIGNQYLRWVDSAPHNAFYERPAMLNLLGDVTGLRVLDAGCGDGYYSEQLYDKAFEIKAFDVSNLMVKNFNERLSGKLLADTRDFESSLDLYENEYFDVVVSGLVLHYVSDLKLAYSEVYKKLKMGGVFIFSINHPFSDLKVSMPKYYYKPDVIEEYWPSLDRKIQTHRRPISYLVNLLVNEGFKIEKVLEPKPLKELKNINFKVYKKLLTEPTFICFRVKK